MADKAAGLTYGNGMNLEDKTLDDKSDEVTVGNARKKKKVYTCKDCGATGHGTRRSKDCRYKGMKDKDVQDDIVRISILKATEEAARVATALEASEVQSEGTYDFLGVCYDVHYIQLSQYSIYGRCVHRGIRHFGRR